MSFMFNPHPYDDPDAINHLPLSAAVEGSMVHGPDETASRLAKAFLKESATRSRTCIVAFEGYIAAEFDDVLDPLLDELRRQGVPAASMHIKTAYKPADTLDRELSECLPQDRDKDPVLLFGKLFHGNPDDLLDPVRLADLRLKLEEARQRPPGILIVFGSGSAVASLRDLYDAVVYFDVTPKRAILRAKAGLVSNIGDSCPRPFKELVRRLYYVDFEVAGVLRKQLLSAPNSILQYYVARNAEGVPTLVPRPALDVLLSDLARRPFRCRPVYIEGVWGGSFIRRVRGLPVEIKNVAWSFELIPLEVSIAIETPSGLQIEFPFFTFVQKEGEALMGAETLRQFGGYFPIRFNYDDTWHSSGNMSIQVHPTRDHCLFHHDEKGAQDESYYTVATGHGSKTFLGFKPGVTAGDFLDQARRSEKTKVPIDYEALVHSVPSRPGTQYLLPAGTIHASGQNQVVLEIGSLTVGSYTYKLYDYLRADLDGNPRPIHTWHGEQVLDPRQTAPAVEELLVPKPKCLRTSGDGRWSEWLVGEHKDLYFSLRRFEIAAGQSMEDNTGGIFHVLVLVDGEEVLVQSNDCPEHRFQLRFLDVVVVPAAMGAYTVKNCGTQPAVVHKTFLKDL